MTDIALSQSSADDLAFDLLLDNGDLATDEGLRTAITISIFTDVRASADDSLPAVESDRRGWWGDAVAEIDGDEIGSKLWLLERSKITADVVVRARDYVSAALAWLVADRVAASIDVQAAVQRPDTLAIAVTIARPSGERHRYDYVWTAYS